MIEVKPIFAVEPTIADVANGGASAGMLPITWAELKALRDNAGLVAGMQYRITDYECSTLQENTRSAGHQFDIIVTADDERTLNENARACRHDGDTYFATANLSAWELKYSLDNDIERFAWAQKGGIESMRSSFSNGKPLKRCPSFDATEPYGDGFRYAWGTDADIDDGDGTNFLFSKVEYPNEGDVVYDANEAEIMEIPSSGKGVIFYLKDEWNNECPYDFKNIQFVRPLTNGKYDKDNGTDTWVYTFNCWDRNGAYCYDATATPHDISEQTRQDAQDDGDSAEDGDVCFGNIIKPYHYFDPYGYQDRLALLNDIVFLGVFYDNGYDDGWDSFHCYYNTFGNNCYNNTFGDKCNSNTFGNNCFSNTFGDNCNSNTFGDKCNSNTFGNNCFSNTFGGGCHSNTFNHNCSSNTFGDDVIYNTFGGGCHSNTFNHNCSNNTFGDKCANNTFGNTCANNTFGKNCHLKCLEFTYNKTSDISGTTPEFWFNGVKKW